MAYYQTLKKRRLDLNLSIQDISIQTHLAPESIRAIEDNQLDVFFDDFQYAKVFIRAYCDAIGVNWSMVEPEVSRQIAYYEQKKLYEEQQEAKLKAAAAKAETPVKKTRPVKAKKKNRSHPGGLSRARKLLKWDQKNRLAKTMTILGAILIVCLIALNFLTDYLSQRSYAQAQAARNQEIAEKEQETQKMASQLQSKRDQEQKEAEQAELAARPELSPVVEPAGDLVNQFYVAGAISDDQTVTLNVAGTGGTITIMQNDAVLSTSELTETWSTVLSLKSDQTISVIFSNPPGVTGMNINGTGVPMNFEALQAWTSDRVTLYIVTEMPHQSAQTDTDQPVEQSDQAVPETQTQGEFINEPEQNAEISQ